MDRISKSIETVNTELPHIECRLDEALKLHTSFRIGGPVRAMFFPKSTDELVALCSMLRGCGTEPLIIGNGTNLLADDIKPLEIIAVKTTAINDALQTGEEELTACAGISLSKLATIARDCGLSGLEFAHGIPGTLGGAVSMNAGAYGSEMKDVVISSEAYGYDTGTFRITADEHGFSYRHSRFSDSRDVVLSSVIKLKRGDKDSIGAKMDELNILRRESQPLELPSAGSTFKRPKDGYAAKLIENAGLKGYTVGGAQVSSKHAGFVVNKGGALFSDVMAVIDHVRMTVWNRFGIELEPEIKIIARKDG